jgi:hypothetical protein
MERLTVDHLVMLAESAGLDIPADTQEAILHVFDWRLEAMAKLRDVDVSHVDPGLSFDPRWD